MFGRDCDSGARAGVRFLRMAFLGHQDTRTKNNGVIFDVYKLSDAAVSVICARLSCLPRSNDWAGTDDKILPSARSFAVACFKA